MVNAVPLVGNCRGFVLFPLGSAGPLLCRGKQPALTSPPWWQLPQPLGGHHLIHIPLLLGQKHPHSRLMVFLPYSSTSPTCQRSLVAPSASRRTWDPGGRHGEGQYSIPAGGQLPKELVWGASRSKLAEIQKRALRSSVLLPPNGALPQSYSMTGCGWSFVVPLWDRDVSITPLSPSKGGSFPPGQGTGEVTSPRLSGAFQAGRPNGQHPNSVSKSQFLSG